MIDFRSDNTGRAAPEILDALVRANTGTALGYGADEWTARLQDRFSELFETTVRVFPVATGTAANALSLAALGPSWGLVYCSEAAHINTSEANAAGFFGGGLKLVPVAGQLRPRSTPTRWRRRSPAILPGQTPSRPAGGGQPDPGDRSRRGLPRSTRSRAVAEIAKARGLKVHMDGARFANAVARLGVQPGRDELARRGRHPVVRRDQERRRAVRRDRRVHARARRRARDPAAPRRPGVVEDALRLGPADGLHRERAVAAPGARLERHRRAHRRRDRRRGRAAACSPRSRPTRFSSNCPPARWTRWNATASSSTAAARPSPASSAASTAPTAEADALVASLQRHCGTTAQAAQ